MTVAKIDVTKDPRTGSRGNILWHKFEFVLVIVALVTYTVEFMSVNI